MKPCNQQTYFGLKLSIMLFSIVEQLSVSLQAVETTVNNCYHAADLCVCALERNRSDETFQSFFKEEANGKCDPPVLPRKRRLPRGINDGAQQHHFSAAQYFEAIDCVKEELKRHFHQGNFLFIREVESMLINSANGKAFSIPLKLKELYNQDLDFDKLSLQIQMLPDAVKQYS